MILSMADAVNTRMACCGTLSTRTRLPISFILGHYTGSDDASVDE